MGERPTDVLELLLPHADEPELARARKTTTFLRLLVDDARTRAGETVGLGLARARREMTRLQRTDLLDVLEDLLRLHLGAGIDPASFLAPAPPRRSVQDAWSELERHRGANPDLPAVPAPGESPGEVSDRLLVALGEHEADGAGRLRLWRAWRTSLAASSGEREAPWRELLAEPRPEALPRELEVAAVAAVAQCRLDRGAVRAARDWLDDHLGTVSSAPSLVWLLAWSQLLLGQGNEAAATVRGLEPWAGMLPAALAELRRRLPRWAPLLPGRVGKAALGNPMPGPEDESDRHRWGAVVLAVFAHASGGAARLVHADVAPGLADRFEAWRAAREAAPAGPGEPEHRLFVRARADLAHRTGRTPLAGALGKAASLSLARVPVLDGEGEVQGWIHLESEHHLLPPAAHLHALAEGWRRRIVEVAARTAGHAGEGDRRAVVGGPSGAEEGLAPDDPRALAARSFTAGLALKTAMRRWWCLDVQGDDVRCVAEGGGALRDWRRAPGGGRALRRALATGAAIVYAEQEPGLAQAADAASGIAVPLREAGRVRAVLVVESTRRRDFRSPDAERLAAAARDFAPHWRAAQFRAWHLARFGHDVHVDPDGLGLGRLSRDLPVTGRVRTPVALVGAEGVGKEVLARWIHFEGTDPAAPFVSFPCGVEAAGIVGCGRPVAGTVLLDGIADLPPPRQIELRNHLARGPRGARPLDPGPSDPRPRFLATSHVPLAEHVAAGRLRADLAARFQRLELRVPPLRDRRDEIPPLVELLALRFAREEEIAPVRLEDEAVALLWRQPWSGNVRELEGLVYKLAVFHPGECLDGATVRAVAGRFGLELVARVPSRRPRRRDLQAALRVTRCATGSWNKTRAALYLGWDPDTLATRLREAEDLGGPGPGRA